MTDDVILWKDMTPEQKGALLLANYENKLIEMFSPKSKSWLQLGSSISNWYDTFAYRIKPEATKIQILAEIVGTYVRTDSAYPNISITFDMIDGEPDCNSVKLKILI